jgi:hypothetical protein
MPRSSKGATLVQRDGDFLDTGIPGVQRVGMALAAIADDADLPALDEVEVGVMIVISPHWSLLCRIICRRRFTATEDV